MLLRPGVLTDAGHEPAHLLARGSAGDREASGRDLAGDVKVRRRSTDGSELVAELGVERAEVARHSNRRPTARVEHGRAAVDVEPLWRFHEAVFESPVGRVLRVVDDKRTAALAQGAFDEDVAYEVARLGALPEDGCPCRVVRSPVDTVLRRWRAAQDTDRAAVAEDAGWAVQAKHTEGATDAGNASFTTVATDTPG